MTTIKKDSLTFKIIVFLSIIRWYNILLTAIAQYLAAFFIFNQWYSRWQILTDIKLHIIVICTSIFIAAGYLINFFYDKETDLINYPKRTRLFLHLNKNFLINSYFFLIIIGLILAFMASLKIGIYFFSFSFLVWLYSHKIKKIAYLREITATLLTLTSFFSITLHYALIETDMFLYGWFIFFIILIREGIKDLEHTKGNAVYSYYSSSIINKPSFFLLLLKILALLAYIPIFVFYYIYQFKHNSIFFMIAISFIMLAALFIIHQKYESKYAQISNNLLKIAIALSLLGMVWL